MSWPWGLRMTWSNSGTNMRHVHFAQDGSTVLINAAANGHADCVRLLLESGADMEAKNNVRAAVAHARVWFLHEFGNSLQPTSDLNDITWFFRNSDRHYHFRHEYFSLIGRNNAVFVWLKCLQDGNTALVCAATKRHSRCVRLLVDNGAYKEAKNAVRSIIFRL